MILQMLHYTNGLVTRYAAKLFIYWHNISLAWGGGDQSTEYLPTWLSESEAEGLLNIFDILQCSVNIHDSIHLCMYSGSEAQIHSWRAFWWNVGVEVVNILKMYSHSYFLFYTWRFRPRDWNVNIWGIISTLCTKLEVWNLLHWLIGT